MKTFLAAWLALFSTFASAQNLSDHWFNPDESGWGLSITHQGPVIFAVLFIYSRTSVDQAGKGAPEWYVMPDMRDPGFGMSPIPPVLFRGTLYAGRGSPYNATITATFDGQVVTLPACVLRARITGTRTTNVNAF